VNDNMMALLDREPKEGLEYFRGAMQKLLAPYPGSYDLLGKVVAAFYVYEQTQTLPPIDEESTELYLFLTDREARSTEERDTFQAVENLLCLLLSVEESDTGSSWDSFLTALEDAWTQHT